MRATTVPEITTDQLARAQAEGPIVIDVRELYEYLAGHVPGAIPVPMGQLPSPGRAIEAGGSRAH